jgi:hypothetical protein
MRLRLTLPASHDPSEAVRECLRLLGSPILDRLPPPAGGGPHRLPEPASTDNVSHLAAFGEFFDPQQWSIELTVPQRDIVSRIVSTVCRRLPPTCPILLGASGSGKTTLARCAAKQLLNRGEVQDVLLVYGSELTCGALFRSQRDACLQELLEAISEFPDTLLLIEQYQLAVGQSQTGASLLAAALDQGLRMIAVASPGLPLGMNSATELLRRVESIRVPTFDSCDVGALLKARLARHPAADKLEIAPEVLSTVMRVAEQRPGADPGAALGLLEAVLSDCKCRGVQCVGPDDVYGIAGSPSQ